MTYQEDPTHLIKERGIKTYLKHTFVRLLLDLFDAEPDWDLAVEANEEGLKISTKFPLERREVPCIVISLRNVKIQRMTLNRDLGPAFVDHWYEEGADPTVAKNQQVSPVQGYVAEGFCQLDVLAKTDTQRDSLIDKISDYILLGKMNAANLDAFQELQLRRIVINPTSMTLVGDTEVPLGDGVLTYVDGTSISFIAEYGTFSDDAAVPLESIITDINFQ